MKRILLLSALVLTASYFAPRIVRPVIQANESRGAIPAPVPDVTQRIVFAALDAGLPPEIALQRFWEESRLIHSNDGVILESDGNCGLAQLNRRWTKNACEMTQDESIREGVRQLAEYWNEFHDERRTVIAYTRGITKARADR